MLQRKKNAEFEWGSEQQEASLVAQPWRICLPVLETQVQFLSQKDPLKKEMATHSSILAWEIPWTNEFGRLQSRVSEKSGTRLSNWKTIATEQQEPMLGPLPNG